MKNRFSSLDITCIVKELQALVGMRVNQIYDIDTKTYLIKLQLPEKKSVLIIESGIRLNRTTFDWPKNDHPSGFCMKLRKHLRNKRLENVKQLNKDRIVNLQFGSGEASYHIIIELFDKGNIILTDHSMMIVNALRFHSEGVNKCLVRELYSLEPKKKADEDKKSISDVLLQAKVGDPFRKMLMPFIDYGPACLEHILFNLGYEKGAKVKTIFTAEEVETFVTGFYSALKDVEKVCSEAAKGFIIKKRETRANAEVLFTNVEFHPFHFQQFSNESFDEFEDFNSAVDEFFSQMESQKIDMKALHDEKAALKKVDKIRQDQASRLKDLDKKQQVDALKAELITYNIDKVEEAITTIRSALAAQMSWSEITELVENAKDDPVGSLISKLKFETNSITLKLENPFSEDEKDPGVLVDVDLDLSAYANVKKYYTDKKSASSKQQKTLQAQSIALKSAEKKVESVLKDIQMNVSITKSRLIFWFEKFFWFISSENYLVIGSRDRIQAELIIRRYMTAEDVFVHTDVPGSSCFVIKNPSGGQIPPKTLNEAGAMAVCFSSAWNVHIITNAWWVRSEQVVKLNPVSGLDQFYLVTGQKNYLMPGQLAIGFGFVFYIDETSIERHSSERQIKYTEEAIENVDSLQSSESLEVSTTFETEGSLEEGDNPECTANSESDSESDNSEPIDDNDLTVDKSETDSVSSSGDIRDSITSSEYSVQPDREQNEEVELLNLSSSKPEDADLKETIKDLSISESARKGKKGKNNNKIQISQGGKNKTEMDGNALKRGQRSKLKKIKEKYKDQDEEEKQLRMAILQSAGSKKDTKKSLKQAKEQQALERKVKKKPPPPKKQDNRTEEEEVEPDVPVETDLSMLNRLTGIPHPEDKIIFALPMVAPYSTVVPYKYRVKMIPGTGKRGKSARSALNIFLNGKETNDQEKAVMKNVSDQILCRDLPGKVKLSVGQLTAKLRKKR